MYACYAGCPELVRLLLERGADPWAGDRCGQRTALHYAASEWQAAGAWSHLTCCTLPVHIAATLLAALQLHYCSMQPWLTCSPYLSIHYVLCSCIALCSVGQRCLHCRAHGAHPSAHAEPAAA